MSKWNPGAADITKDDHEIDFASSITSKFILSCFCHLNNILKNVEKNRKQKREKLCFFIIIHKATFQIMLAIIGMLMDNGLIQVLNFNIFL